MPQIDTRCRLQLTTDAVPFLFKWPLLSCCHKQYTKEKILFEWQTCILHDSGYVCVHDLITQHLLTKRMRWPEYCDYHLWPYCHAINVGKAFHYMICLWWYHVTNFLYFLACVWSFHTEGEIQQPRRLIEVPRVVLRIDTDPHAFGGRESERDKAQLHICAVSSGLSLQSEKSTTDHGWTSNTNEYCYSGILPTAHWSSAILFFMNIYFSQSHKGEFSMPSWLWPWTTRPTMKILILQLQT